jgi:uncharacterized protein GlcG (DUF336 family)
LADEHRCDQFGRQPSRVFAYGWSAISLDCCLRAQGAHRSEIRRPTKVLEDAIQKSDYKYVLSVDDVIATRGGIPLIEDRKIIGAIGCSGSTGLQDEAVRMVGAATINK